MTFCRYLKHRSELFLKPTIYELSKKLELELNIEDYSLKKSNSRQFQNFHSQKSSKKYKFG